MSDIDKVQEIERRYAARGISKAGELLLRPADALLMLDDLASLDAGVLGVNVWYYVGSQLAESLESADMSTIVGTPHWRQLSQDGARQFIKYNLPSNTGFVSLILE